MSCSLAKIVYIFLLVVALPAYGQDAIPPDPINLATRLIKDGHLDRAYKVIQTAKISANPPDASSIGTVTGLYHLYRKEFTKAKDQLEGVIATRRAAGMPSDPYVHVYLAQAHFGREDFKNCLVQLEQTGELVYASISLTLIKIRSDWNLGHQVTALAELDRAEARFSGERLLQRQRIEYYVQLDLGQATNTLVSAYLKSGPSVADLKALAQIFFERADLRQTLIMILEAAHLESPADIGVITQLGLLYAKSDAPLGAARMFEKAADFENRFYKEAAAMHMRAGNLYRALFLNGHLLDQKEKLKQRLAILLKLGQYSKVTAMLPSLKRHGLVDNDEVRYAIAYAWFRQGAFEQAKEHLGSLKSVDFFKKATALRHEMSVCKQNPLQCLG